MLNWQAELNNNSIV